MSILKDLFYTKGNQNLDISRLMVGLSIVLFWGCVVYDLASDGDFDPVASGTGAAALFAGGGAWIFARQKHEGAGDEAQ